MSREQTILKNIHQLAERQLPKGSKVWLYGSRARGDYHDGSDWDLLLLLDKDKVVNADHDNYAYPFIALGWDYGETISPLLYSKKEWEGYSFTPWGIFSLHLHRKICHVPKLYTD